MRSLAALTKCTQPAGQVCLLAISVNLQFTLKIVISFSRMFSMCLVLRRICFQFISSHIITMLSLRLILGIFFLRIGIERCRNDLYPLLDAVLPKQRVNKSVLGAVKLSVARWHYRLGHASSPIVQRVLSGNNLSCSKEKIDALVCDVC
jgi:hypothetical protein